MQNARCCDESIGNFYIMAAKKLVSQPASFTLSAIHEPRS